ncbi:MAG: hypothetical protein Kow0077_25020 [Anaerolineae bacterium]
MLYLAYTREDALFAVQLAEDLQALGIEVWLDINEIAPGHDWEAAQQAAIEACEGLVIVLSPEAMRREHMRREVQRAFNRRKTIFLAVARPSPWRSWLNGLPLADFTSDYDAGLDALVLNIMGDQRRGEGAQMDDATRWLQQAERAPRPKQQPASTGEKPPSILGRLFRRSSKRR